MLSLRLCFCILVRCLFTLHGSLASWLLRTLVNVLENNLVLRLTAILSLLLSCCFLGVENCLREQGKARTRLLPGLLINGSGSAATPSVPSLKRSWLTRGFTEPGRLANHELQRSDVHIVKDELGPRASAGDGTSESVLPH